MRLLFALLATTMIAIGIWAYKELGWTKHHAYLSVLAIGLYFQYQYFEKKKRQVPKRLTNHQISYGLNDENVGLFLDIAQYKKQFMQSKYFSGREDEILVNLGFVVYARIHWLARFDWRADIVQFDSNAYNSAMGQYNIAHQSYQIAFQQWNSQNSNPNSNKFMQLISQPRRPQMPDEDDFYFTSKESGSSQLAGDAGWFIINKDDTQLKSAVNQFNEELWEIYGDLITSALSQTSYYSDPDESIVSNQRFICLIGSSDGAVKEVINSRYVWSDAEIQSNISESINNYISNSLSSELETHGDSVKNITFRLSNKHFHAYTVLLPIVLMSASAEKEDIICICDHRQPEIMLIRKSKRKK